LQNSSTADCDPEVALVSDENLDPLNTSVGAWVKSQKLLLAEESPKEASANIGIGRACGCGSAAVLCVHPIVWFCSVLQRLQ